MSEPNSRPGRSLRSELFPLVAVLGLSAVLYYAFISVDVGSGAGKQGRRVSPYFALVELDGDREARLLADARSAWQSDPASRRGKTANLIELGGEVEVGISSSLKPSVRGGGLPVAEYASEHIPAGLAAEPPARLPIEKDVVPPPPFPKSELLKLD